MNRFLGNRILKRGSRTTFWASRFALAFLLLSQTNIVFAQSKPRIWRDGSGKFSVEARVIDQYQNEVVLEKADGTRITVPRDRFSESDQRRLKSIESLPLRSTNKTDLLAIEVDVPILPSVGPTISLDTRVAPVKVAADAKPVVVETIPFVRPLQSMDGYNVVGLPIAVSGDTFASTVYTNLKSRKQGSRIYRVQANNRKPEIALELKQAFRFLDHHRDSDHTLAVIDCDGSGDFGGDLLLMEGLGNGQPKALGRARIPREVGSYGAPQIRKGRLIGGDKAAVWVNDIVYVWSLANGELLARFENVQSGFDLSGTGRFLAIGVSGAVQVIDLAERQVIGSYEFPNILVPSVAFSPDGTKMAAMASDTCRIWDLTAATILSEKKFDEAHTLLHGWVNNDMILTHKGLVIAATAELIWKYSFPSSAQVLPIAEGVVFTEKIPNAALSCLPIPHRKFTRLGSSRVKQGKWEDSDGGAPPLVTANSPEDSDSGNGKIFSTSNKPSLPEREFQGRSSGLELLDTNDAISTLSKRGRQVMFAPNEYVPAIPADVPSAAQESSSEGFQAYTFHMESKPQWSKSTVPLWVDREDPIYAVSVYEYERGADPSYGRIYVNSPENHDPSPVLDLNTPLVLLDHYQPKGYTLANYGPDLVVLENLASKEPDVIARWHLPNWQRSTTKNSIENARWVNGEYVIIQLHTDLYCWSLATGETQFKIDTKNVSEMAISPNGRYLAITDSSECFLIDVVNAEPIGKIDLGELNGGVLHFSPNGRFLGVCYGKKFRVWDLPAGKVAASVTLDSQPGNFLGWVDNASLLTELGGLLRFDPESGEIFQVWDYWLSLHDVRLVPGGIIGVPKVGDFNFFALPLPHQPGILARVRGMVGKRTKIKNGQWKD